MSSYPLFDLYGPAGPTWQGVTGYFYLGPITRPPLVPLVGMTDRTTGTVEFLYWNGTTGLTLSSTRSPALQNYSVYGPWDGPYISGVRMGVNNAAINLDVHNGWQFRQDHPIICPTQTTPLAQSYPEPTNYPAPGIPSVPGIPSSTPPPTGGGYAAFEAAYAANTPPLLIAVYNNKSGKFDLKLYAPGGPYTIVTTNI